MSQIAASEKFRDHGIFLLRLLLGALFVAHAAGSLLSLPSSGEHAPGAVYAIVVAEIIVGISLLIGFQVRLAAIGAVAVLAASGWLLGGSGWLIPGSTGGREITVLLALVAIVQSLLGDGRYAISKSLLLRWRRNRQEDQQAQPA